MSSNFTMNILLNFLRIYITISIMCSQISRTVVRVVQCKPHFLSVSPLQDCILSLYFVRFDLIHTGRLLMLVSCVVMACITSVSPCRLSCLALLGRYNHCMNLVNGVLAAYGDNADMLVARARLHKHFGRVSDRYNEI